jgi:DNA-binding GntR family transcriptional regulator
MTDGGANAAMTEFPEDQPRSRRPLHEEAADRLRDMIVEGELAPGERVREQAICNRLGLSRTPLREALKMLAAEGLIVLQPNRGAMVSDPSAEGIADTFKVIGALEALAGVLACKRVEEDDVAEIRVLHYQMALHQTRGELREYFKLNQRIHERLVELSGNAVLIETHKQLGGRIRRQRFVANRSGQRWEQAMQEHEQMLEALAARDGQRLAELLRRHLDNKLAAAERVDKNSRTPRQAFGE